MKNLFTLLFMALMFSFNLNGQIKTPAPSPSASFTQDIGLNTITVEYSRPSMKGRTIFGDDALVPNGAMWRTGANAPTKLTTDGKIMIEGKELDKGSYVIVTTPGASSWDVNFYTDEGGYWSEYKEKTPTLSAKVTPKKSGMTVESFMIFVDNLRNDGATLNMAWDNMIVPVKIGTMADESVMKSIDKVMAGPSASDYYAAGLYYFKNGKDMDKAVKWMEKGTEGDDPKFWQLKNLAELYAKVGNKKKAIKTAQKSLELATKAGNNDYIKMNKDNLAMWK